MFGLRCKNEYIYERYSATESLPAYNQNMSAMQINANKDVFSLNFFWNDSYE